jgi:hypothetical protein
MGAARKLYDNTMEASEELGLCRDIRPDAASGERTRAPWRRRQGEQERRAGPRREARRARECSRQPPPAEECTREMDQARHRGGCARGAWSWEGRSGREVLGRTRHRRQAVGTGAGSCGARNGERQGARHRGRRPSRGTQGWAIQDAQESELDKRTTMGIAGRTEPSACQQRAAGSVAQGAGRRGSRAVKNWRRQRLQQDFYPRVERRRDELREEKKSKATAAGKIGGVSSVKKSERGERSAGKHLQGSQ